MTPWHSLPSAQVLRTLDSSDDGLAEAEAGRRLARDGPNAFRPAPRTSAWVVLVAQLRSVLVLLLVVAGALAAATGDPADAVAIAAVLVLNVALGFATEFRAHRAMEALLGLEVQRARVVRDGRSREIDARDLVRGDVILVEAGQRVPADARLLQSSELRTMEDSLSGEPAPVSKRSDAPLSPEAPLTDRRTMIYKATSVVAGSGRALVVATGMETEVGRIGELTAGVVKGRTPLERRLDALGRQLAVLAVGVGILVVVLGARHGVPLARLLETAIALAVAAVPEGLPVVGTIAMAVGMRRMARRRALIRHLPVVEALGSASVICTDKTGTLTAGRMTATVLRLADREVDVSGAGLAPEGRFTVDGKPVDPAADPALALLLRIGVLANAADLHRHEGAWQPVGDPTDVAFLVLGRKAAIDRASLLDEWPAVGQLPFSSERMFMASFHRHDDEAVTTFVKGAPRAVIDRCSRLATASGVRPLEPEDRERLLRVNGDLAARGLRVLALATGGVDRSGDDASNLTLVGFVGLSDPPAEGVRETVRDFGIAGIRTVMITGDQRLTAASVARELGIMTAGDDVLEGRDVDRLTDDELDQVLPRVAAFGRVSPEAKLRIVSGLQRRGEIVAMLGDGVNDAAALRKADIGVAMGGRGTDLAKEAADVILQDDRFPTIGVAIEEGRVILANVRKFVSYLFGCNLAEILVLLGASLAGYPTALLPLQILWLNLLTDTFPALALAVEPGERDVMRRPPSSPRAAILPAGAMGSVVAYACLIALVTLVAFGRGLIRDPAVAGTMAFMTLALAQIFHLGNARSATAVLAPRHALSNRAALGAAALALALQLLAAGFTPLRRALGVASLSPAEWLAVASLALVPAVAGQTIKVWRTRSARG